MNDGDLVLRSCFSFPGGINLNLLDLSMYVFAIYKKIAKTYNTVLPNTAIEKSKF